ncbi:hypothetical protein ScPMuIL_009961 [Solemya velum]
MHVINPVIEEGKQSSRGRCSLVEPYTNLVGKKWKTGSKSDSYFLCKGKETPHLRPLQQRPQSRENRTHPVPHLPRLREPTVYLVRRRKLPRAGKTDRHLQPETVPNCLHGQVKSFHLFGTLRHGPRPRLYLPPLTVIEQEKRCIEFARARREDPGSVTYVKLFLTDESPPRP